MAFETPAKLSTFLSKPRGRTQNSAKAIKMLVRMALDFGDPLISETISGPRSPITTKKAMHVPSINPMIPISIINFPRGPNAWKAVKGSLFVFKIGYLKQMVTEKFKSFSSGYNSGL